MKCARVLFAVVLFAAAAAFSQEHPAVTAQANTVYVGADGKFEAAPDTAARRRQRERKSDPELYAGKYG